MAKAKKQGASATSASGGAAKPTKKSVAKKSAAPAAPMIDTSSAAEAAAKMIGRKSAVASAQGEQRESSSFKQLKESLNKPASQGPNAFLQNTAPEKKLNQSFGGRNQVGRNQTYGADVNRTGVPRRTGG